MSVELPMKGYWVAPLLDLVIAVTLMALTGTSVMGVDEEGPTFGDDMTPAIATTGDELTFQVSVLDPSGVFMAHVNYSYGEGVEFSAPLEFEGSGIIWRLTIIIPTSPETLHYHFGAMDTSGNWAESPLRHVQVLDDDPPELLWDSSPQAAIPGRAYVFQAELTDNDGIGGAWVLFWFDTGTTQNLSMMEGHPYTQEALVPQKGVLQLSYYFEVIDRSGHGFRTEVKHVDVTQDLLAPNFGRDSTPREGTTGDSLRFLVEVTDDIDLGEVRVRYRFGEGSLTNRSLEGPSPFSLTIGILTESLAELNYSFYTADLAGNMNTTRWKRVRVFDNDPPIAYAGMDLTVVKGKVAQLNGTGSYDNIGITQVVWTFTYEAEIVTIEGNLTAFTFRVPGEYNVTLVVHDKAGNEGTDGLTVRVLEGQPSVPTSRALEPAPATSLIVRIAPYIVTVLSVGVWIWYNSWRQRPRDWPTGPRSTSRRS
jgi:hypothetical protein